MWITIAYDLNLFYIQSFFPLKRRSRHFSRLQSSRHERMKRWNQFADFVASSQHLIEINLTFVLFRHIVIYKTLSRSLPQPVLFYDEAPFNAKSGNYLFTKKFFSSDVRHSRMHSCGLIQEFSMKPLCAWNRSLHRLQFRFKRNISLHENSAARTHKRRRAFILRTAATKTIFAKKKTFVNKGKAACCVCFGGEYETFTSEKNVKMFFLYLSRTFLMEYFVFRCRDKSKENEGDLHKRSQERFNDTSVPTFFHFFAEDNWVFGEISRGKKLTKVYLMTGLDDAVKWAFIGSR